MYSPLMHLVPVLTHTTTIFFISGSRVITIPAITFVILSVSKITSRQTYRVPINYRQKVCGSEGH